MRVHCFLDSHEFEGDDHGAEVEMSTDDLPSTHTQVLAEKSPSKENEKKAGAESDSGDFAEKPPAKPEYNPLIVRRSQRAIKPTKDVDLYLLGAQYGVDVEGSDADSSDLEFAPEAASEGMWWK